MIMRISKRLLQKAQPRNTLSQRLIRFKCRVVRALKNALITLVQAVDVILEPFLVIYGMFQRQLTR